MLPGWLGVSCASYICGTDVFKESPDYPRVPVNLRGSPFTDAIPGMTACPNPVDAGRMVRYAAVFSAETGGHCLCFWRLASFVECPRDLPPLDVFLVWDTPLLYSINATPISQDVSELVQPARGDRLATVNCSTMFTAIRLLVVSGKLIARASYNPKRALAEAAE
jgi:hypothetical protein